MAHFTENNRLEDIFLKGWYPYAWLIALGVLLYFKTLFFDFTYLDDKALILDNKTFISDLSNIPAVFQQRIFPHLKAPYYRPVLILSFMLNAQLNGTSLFGYHLFNILLHALASCLVFLFLSNLEYRKISALFVSMLFAVHPLLAEAVAWVPGRNDLLLTIFAISSMIFFIRYLRSGKSVFYLWHIIFFGLALFTKETAVFLIIAYILFADLIEKQKIFAFDKVSLFTGWLFIAAFWFLLRWSALIDTWETTLYGMCASLLVSLPAVIQFIGKIVMPFNLSVFPTMRDTTFVYGLISAAAVVTGLAVSKSKRNSFVIFGFAWFMFFLLPSLVRPDMRYVHDFQEHRLYMPIVGFGIMLLEIDFIKKLRLSIRKDFIFPVAVLLTFSVINFVHCDNFRNRLSFWANACLTSPNSKVVRMNMGLAYAASGFPKEAERELKKAISLSPAVGGIYFRLGNFYLDENMLDKAEGALKKELVLDPLNYSAHLSLGVVYYKQGRFGKAVEEWERTLWLKRDNIEARKNLAIYYREKKDFEKSLYYIKQLQKMNVEIPREFLDALKARDSFG
ncbi:MAG: glycosyltransferase family 39 protein, partial [Candidatus Aureabacteria bacterium]|nr:glycosyltransferase family 39 protein [Candidatus Auribacterota bacterium]